ncbi:hypothetical protein [Mesobacillus zeae]|uniref:Uncharacterized protein n=1 Tax=Mesobacillus zeae TaxID=1917180 RepID=A0A398B869_9BACI|nr:hypothetical protein [Mesobacillus zeae]RID85674.1 hypothetical protein D1970_08960 [Mesobacillus zeae]
MDKEIRVISTVKIKGKEYQVRGLNFDDTEIISMILDKTDFDLAKYETEAKELVKASKKNKEKLESLGTAVFLKVITDLTKKYYKVHKEFTELIASLIGVKPENVKTMPISTPLVVLKELAKDEDSLDFFSFLKQ